MRRGSHCPVCDQEECGLHRGALAFAHLLDVCALVGVALLTWLIAAAIVLL